MTMLMKLFSHSIDKDSLNLYWQVLKHISDEEFSDSVKMVVSTFKPTQNCQFPVPADFLTKFNNKQKDVVRRVVNAIESYGSYADIDFGDPALHATIGRFGGWVEVCKWTYKDWEMKSKQFESCYEGCLLSGASGSERLLGYATLQNEKLGYSSSKKQKMLNDMDSIGDLLSDLSGESI